MRRILSHQCPKCNSAIELEISLTAAPAQQSQAAPPPADSLGALLASIDDDTLIGKNAEFVSQIRERYAQYKERTRMSDKQMSWLRSIAAGDANDTW